MQKLPEAEFAVMQALWQQDGPATAAAILQTMGGDRRVQTVITLLNRLAGREFVSTEKIDGQRFYRPLVSEKDYLQFETEHFLQAFHHGSLTHLVASMADSNQVSEDDLQALAQWLKEGEVR